MNIVSDPQGFSTKHDQKIFRKAFIHSASFVFVILCGICALFVYYILEPFLQSILWSLLAGAFLFPLKYSLTKQTRTYLQQLDINSHLLVIGFSIVLPIKLFNSFLDSIGILCWRKWKQLIFILIFLPSIEYLQSGVVYRCLITFIYDYIALFERYIYLFDSSWMLGIIISYFSIVFLFYKSFVWLQILLNVLSMPIWLCLLINLTQILSINYRLVAVTLIIGLITIGFFIELNTNEFDRLKSTQNSKSIIIKLLHICQCIRIYFHKKSNSSARYSFRSSSTSYFTFIFCSLIAIKVYDFSWYLIPFSIFIIIYKILKNLLVYTFNYVRSQERLKQTFNYFIEFWQIRRDVIIPKPFSIVFRCVVKGDKKMNRTLQESMDYLISASIIISLFILIFFGTIWLLIQIQYESLDMIKLTSSFVNQMNLFRNMLPDKEYFNDLLDKAFNKFYTIGKTWITAQIAKVQPPRREPTCCLPLNVRPNESPFMHMNTLGPGSSLSNKNLEEQVLQLWENLYTYLTNTSTLFFMPKNRSRRFSLSSTENLFGPNMYKFIQTNFDFHSNDFYRLIHDNLDLLRTIFDSIWSNTTIILTFLSTVFSLLFTSGFALFNFFVSFFVFITLLFYLLSHSNQPVYQPTEWLNSFLAIGGSGLGQAVNDAITSVFLASLKIALFYGLYTYITHTLLGSNLVYIPAVIASICAVTLKSYWAALPGCLDLWLVQQRPLSALALLIVQIIPVYIVDTAIYSEVKGGGHQYLTALAIAGGVYYRGIEGALIGPIILCCLLVGIRMYSETMTAPFLFQTDKKPRFSRSISVQPVVTKHF